MRKHVAVLRVVVREGFSRDLADELLDAIREAIAFLEKHPPVQSGPAARSFAH